MSQSAAIPSCDLLWRFPEYLNGLLVRDEAEADLVERIEFFVAFDVGHEVRAGAALAVLAQFARGGAGAEVGRRLRAVQERARADGAVDVVDDHFHASGNAARIASAIVVIGQSSSICSFLPVVGQYDDAGHDCASS